MKAKFENISVKITRHFGTVTIEVGHEAAYEVESREQRNGIYQGCMAMLQKQIEEFSREGLNAPPPAPLLGDVRTEILSNGKLEGRIEKGKLLVKWIGGKYSKYGVPVYDEVFEPLDFAPNEYTSEAGINLEGWTVEIEVENGKAKRVSKLVAP